ncbi:MAG: hypothetical protein DME53_07710 [Verrucomicrobia bacterium]|nr:MAG: hypothetical protein DME53_07710 [Verrucomicrobiota bacterium]
MVKNESQKRLGSKIARTEVGVIRGSDVFVIRVDWCPFVVKSGKSVGKFPKNLLDLATSFQIKARLCAQVTPVDYGSHAFHKKKEVVS